MIGIPFGEETHQKDFSYSVTLFEKQCLPKPKLLLYNSVVPLAAILLTLLIMALMAAKVAQLRLMVCEQFFSTAAEQRVQYLHAKILRKRLKKRKEKNNCSSTSLYFKVCITVYHKVKLVNLCVECIRLICLLFPGAFLVPAALQAQRGSAKYRVRKLFFLLHKFFIL